VDGFACCDGTPCAAGSTCASGYCKANVAPPPDAGTLRATGAACTANGQCQGAICVPQTAAGTATCPTTACWPAGYCSQSCNGSACDPGSSCTPYFGVGPRCLQNCAFDGGQGSCRAGYICDRNWIAGSPQSTCVYGCGTDQDCPLNTQCNLGSHFCCGRTTYACCPGSTCPFGGSCGASGYCE
jgi:hypothetical protein